MNGVRQVGRRREVPPFPLVAGRARTTTATGSVLAAVAVVVVLTSWSASPAAPASPASAAEAPDGEIVVQSDHIPDFTEQGIAPGDPAQWRITGTPTADADVRVDVAVSGDLSAGTKGLWLELERCSGPWTITANVASCDGTRDVVVASRPFAEVAGRSIALGHVLGGTPVRLLAEVRAGSTPPDEPVVTATLDLTLHASGISPGDPGSTSAPGAGGTGGSGGGSGDGSGVGRPGGPGSGSGDTVASGGSVTGAGPGLLDPFGALAWTGSWSGWTFLAGLGAAFVVVGVGTRIRARARSRRH